MEIVYKSIKLLSLLFAVAAWNCAVIASRTTSLVIFEAYICTKTALSALTEANLIEIQRKRLIF